MASRNPTASRPRCITIPRCSKPSRPHLLPHLDLGRARKRAAEPGDFITTTIGRQPVIVVRDKTGEINVLQNRCRHRGATVRIAQGQREGLHVPVSQLVVRARRHAARCRTATATKACAKGDLPLVKLRVGVYQGLIFASFNDAIEPLEDFLGGAKPWIDLFMKQGAGYPIKANGEHKFRFKGNWKIQLENTTDLYHFPVVHKSWMKSIDDETAAAITSFMTSEDAFCRGRQRPQPRGADARADRPRRGRRRAAAERFAPLAAKLAERHTPEEVRRIVRSLMGVGFNLNLFPNLALSMAFFRVLRPISANETEIRHVALAMDGGPEANRERLRIHEHFQRSVSAAPTTRKRGSACNAARIDVPILVNRGLNRETTAANGENRACNR